MSTGELPGVPGAEALAAGLAPEIARRLNQLFAEPDRSAAFEAARGASSLPTPPGPGGVASSPTPQVAGLPASPTFLVPGGPGLPPPENTLSLGIVERNAPDPGGAPYFLTLAGADRGTSGRAPAAVPFQLQQDGAPRLGGAAPAFDPHVVRRDFPILEERVHGRRLVWLDNAATTQKPLRVIERLAYYYEHENSNIHRGAHTLAARATDAYEAAREKVRRFLNAPSAKDIVFVRGATEGINLIAQSWGRDNVGPGDEIVVTHLEHHANIVPWQRLAEEKGAKLLVAPVDDTGQILLDAYGKLLGPKTRLVAFTQVSNALGTVLPAREMIAMAHRRSACVLLDGAQAVSHLPVDVQALDCDFYVFSGHKVFAPTGIGAVFGKAERLAAMSPWQGGGNMIADVTFERTLYQPAPARFEAGTGNIADAVGLGAALDYVDALGRPAIERYEHDLRVHAEACLATIPGLRFIGTAREKAGVISFVLDGVRTEDVGKMLDQDGIAVRSGHHCAQPILRRFGLEASVRASLAPYNTREDVEVLAAAVRRIQLGRPLSPGGRR